MTKKQNIITGSALVAVGLFLPIPFSAVFILFGLLFIVTQL